MSSISDVVSPSGDKASTAPASAGGAPAVPSSRRRTSAVPAPGGGRKSAAVGHPSCSGCTVLSGTVKVPAAPPASAATPPPVDYYKYLRRIAATQPKELPLILALAVSSMRMNLSGTIIRARLVQHHVNLAESKALCASGTQSEKAPDFLVSFHAGLSAAVSLAGVDNNPSEFLRNVTFTEDKFPCIPRRYSCVLLAEEADKFVLPPPPAGAPVDVPRPMPPPAREDFELFRDPPTGPRRSSIRKNPSGKTPAEGPSAATETPVAKSKGKGKATADKPPPPKGTKPAKRAPKSKAVVVSSGEDEAPVASKKPAPPKSTKRPLEDDHEESSSKRAKKTNTGKSTIRAPSSSIYSLSILSRQEFNEPVPGDAKAQTSSKKASDKTPATAKRGRAGEVPHNAAISGGRSFVSKYSSQQHEDYLKVRKTPQYFQGKASESGVIGIYHADLQRLVELLPPVIREDLPMDKEGQYFVISHDMVRRLLSLSLPAKGPRCNNCLGTGVECKSYGHPMACTACKDRHLSGTCNFAQSDEFRSDTSSELNRFFEMSAPGFKAQAERIAQSEFLLNQMTDMYSTILGEHHYLILCFLQQVVNAQAELDPTPFSERFAGADDEERAELSETILRIAMAQQIAPGEKIARERVWNYYDPVVLDSPIPGHGSAYSFYTALSRRKLNEPKGFFLLPTDNDAGLPAGWQPLLDTEFIVTTEDGVEIPLGILPDVVCKRLVRQAVADGAEVNPADLELDSKHSFYRRLEPGFHHILAHPDEYRLNIPAAFFGLAATERSHFVVSGAEDGAEEGLSPDVEDEGDHEGGREDTPTVGSPMEVDPKTPPPAQSPHYPSDDELEWSGVGEYSPPAIEYFDEDENAGEPETRGNEEASSDDDSSEED
ncbi:hypothetical protein MVEN_00891000 [Mycena venus]|uniref:Uncharacterized protein n=1 Tax=Mycena venus TaxID=2733690 RepID=A0A8H7D4F7_9AGAR|nr:hypothetical protein MVEN_00891000 [Mycena venus]